MSISGRASATGKVRGGLPQRAGEARAARDTTELVEVHCPEIYRRHTAQAH